MAGRDRVGVLVPMRHALFYDYPAHLIGCGERRHERRILAAFQIRDVLDGAASGGMASDSLVPIRNTVSRRILARRASLTWVRIAPLQTPAHV
jgi:hypothetical protein